MAPSNRSKHRRSVRPVLDKLEERALLSAAMPHHTQQDGVSAHVVDVKNQMHQQSVASGQTIKILNSTSLDGYQFTNFDGPNPGTMAGDGTNMNGISNSGNAVGFTIANDGSITNYVVNPLKHKSLKILNINGSTKAMALGINSAGTVVGTDGHGNAFYLNHGNVKTFIPNGGSSAVAFGINDHGTVVGQYTASSGTMPGFVRFNSKSYVTINAPSGPNTVNPQGVNNKGLVEGFYVGTDGQDHGFMTNQRSTMNGSITGTAIADPTIPPVTGEAGATFVLSQILGVNDHGIAVGYYGDSTTSQHEFIYNTNTGRYTFLDDPNEAFNNGVEVTEITGITNSGEITGFYSDANGVFHAFVATPSRH
jgi:uncharacterized membrane protein